MSIGTIEEFNKETSALSKIFLSKIKFSAPKPSYKITGESNNSSSLYEE